MEKKSIVDLLNGQTELLSRPMPEIIRLHEEKIYSLKDGVSRNGTAHQLVSMVIQDISNNSRNEKSPIDGGFYVSAMELYK